MENPIKMDDLGVPLFLETPISMDFSGSNVKGIPQLAGKIPLIYHL